MTRDEAKHFVDEQLQNHKAATSTPPGAQAAPAAIDWVKIFEILKFVVDNIPVGKK